MRHEFQEKNDAFEQTPWVHQNPDFVGRAQEVQEEQDLQLPVPFPRLLLQVKVGDWQLDMDHRHLRCWQLDSKVQQLLLTVHHFRNHHHLSKHE